MTGVEKSSTNAQTLCVQRKKCLLVSARTALECFTIAESAYVKWSGPDVVFSSQTAPEGSWCGVSDKFNELYFNCADFVDLKAGFSHRNDSLLGKVNNKWEKKFIFELGAWMLEQQIQICSTDIWICEFKNFVPTNILNSK
jgi:hypothetical protein